MASASAPIDGFLEFLKPVLGTILFLSHRLLCQITIVETMDSGERKLESCRSDYHQSSERQFGEQHLVIPLELVDDCLKSRTRHIDLLMLKEET